MKQFLPTMRMKILEVVDISTAIRKIKELKISGNNETKNGSDNDNNTVNELWDEIKISSITLLFMSAYMVSAVTVLLRVQLHILGKSMENIQDSQSLDDAVNDELFRNLIEGTYKHIFGTGLNNLLTFIRAKVILHFGEWSVTEKFSVDYDELVSIMENVHREIEEDSGLIKAIMLPPEATTPPKEHTPNNTPGGGDEGTPLLEPAEDPLIQQLLFQTWDVIESPMFSSVFKDATNICLDSILRSMKCNVFCDEDNNRRSPPLARLLPQLKGVAMTLLPSETTNVTSEVREILSSPSLDTLCISLFNLGLPSNI
eukprot:CAMPEP_0119034826 /NCGR_PEP_ID=MMETSP1177-20130426/1830_1 /TAXON_ID=2985 /ORGANISM="Ochromonas sp, Strain CCMP1899" /LENGTH=313 /DNA_ID=CAMNT_0006992559 /DNA_START=361 /DNA_END=1302 /DNA_ORIENTATION=+